MHIFGVRHLSPAAAFHLTALLERVSPQAVLVEGPSDVTPWIKTLTSPGSVPPLAVMAYTAVPPVRSLLIPFACYSPEYAALKWAAKRGVNCRFIDLPSGVFLAAQNRTADGDAADGSEF
jgi:hypothetical protein